MRFLIRHSWNSKQQ